NIIKDELKELVSGHIINLFRQILRCNLAYSCLIIIL
ncbi:unnamed protein product, partial [marine sediment metagenome]